MCGRLTHEIRPRGSLPEEPLVNRRAENAPRRGGSAGRRGKKMRAALKRSEETALHEAAPAQIVDSALVSADVRRRRGSRSTVKWVAPRDGSEVRVRPMRDGLEVNADARG